MKAFQSDFSFMTNAKMVEIPFFQRAYVWGKEEWEQLFSDLEGSYIDNKDHFLGSIIIRQKMEDGKITGGMLIDGQQRLTTFSILVKALYDTLKNDGKADFAHYLFRAPIADRLPKIEHSRHDRADFGEILRANGVSELSGIKASKLKSCYSYFSNKVGTLRDKTGFLNFILDSELWVVINLGADENEQKIFDSINTTGLQLTATDIIKNSLFARAIALECDYENLYKEYWESVFEAKEDREFWEDELSQGRVRRVRSEVFFHAFAVIEGFFGPGQGTLENLSETYKKKFDSFTADTLQQFLESMKQHAVIYRNLPQNVRSLPLRFDDNESRLFHIIQITHINTVVPLILYLKIRLADDTERLNKIFYLLELFLLTRWLCKKSTSGYSGVFTDIVNHLRESKEEIPTTFKQLLSDRGRVGRNYTLPSRDDVEAALRDLDSRKGRLVLFWIELHRRRHGHEVSELNYEPYNIEYLMPEDWEQDWKFAANDPESAWKLIYQIGNMTLVRGSISNELKSRAWNLKLNGDSSGKAHLKSCADLLVAQEVLENESWGESQIEERTKSLIDEFFSIWNVDKLDS